MQRRTSQSRLWPTDATASNRRNSCNTTPRCVAWGTKCETFFNLISSRAIGDCGCGRGEDIELLGAQGVIARGWNPAFRPEAPRTPAEIVSLSYVINVIEDPAERAKALAEAWSLTTRMLVVAARVSVDGRGYGKVEFGDGIVTGMGTFQKYFTQAELKEYLESQLSVEAIPATIGVYYLFRGSSGGRMRGA